MEKIEITKKMLEGIGSGLLATGQTTDEILNFYGWGDRVKTLKFVVCKGFIDDWCIYIEDMSTSQSYERVREVGNKLSPHTAKKLIKCSDEVLGRYRL